MSILITGGAKNIGLEMACRFATRGSDVFLTTGMNVTWNACFAAGLPANVFAQTVDQQCASGLMAIRETLDYLLDY